MREFKKNNLAPANIPQDVFGELGDYEKSRMRNGAGDGIRTRDLLITNQLLCQLSYASYKNLEI